MTRLVPLIVPVLASVLFVVPIRVHAAPSGDAAAAANAYEQGQRAELARDHRRAAEMFELADSMVPSPEALRAALKNYEMAGATARAATLAWSLRQRYDDAESQELSARVLDAAVPDLVSVRVTCTTPCTVSAEGRALAHVPATSHRVFLAAGRHDLEFVFGKDSSVLERVEGQAGDDVRLDIERPPDPEPVSASPEEPAEADTSSRARLSPAWFVIGATVTTGLGATLAWSGTDVLAINRRYVADPTQERLDDGQSAELRTNVLIGVTAAAAASTIVLAVFTDWKRWKRGEGRRATRPRVSPWVSLDGSSVGLGGHF